MGDCLFCMIIRKEIPAAIVFEDDTVLAFKDISPQAPVHILLVPKVHCSGLDDLTPEALAAVPHLLQTAARLAKEKGVSGHGYRLLANCGPDAGQTVFHLHFHLLGGKPLGAMAGG
jgi:histidine triad (HIT) family protein